MVQAMLKMTDNARNFKQMVIRINQAALKEQKTQCSEFKIGNCRNFLINTELSKIFGTNCSSHFLGLRFFQRNFMMHPLRNLCTVFSFFGETVQKESCTSLVLYFEIYKLSDLCGFCLLWVFLLLYSLSPHFSSTLSPFPLSISGLCVCLCHIFMVNYPVSYYCPFATIFFLFQCLVLEICIYYLNFLISTAIICIITGASF